MQGLPPDGLWNAPCPQNPNVMLCGIAEGDRGAAERAHIARCRECTAALTGLTTRSKRVDADDGAFRAFLKKAGEYTLLLEEVNYLRFVYSRMSETARADGAYAYLATMGVQPPRVQEFDMSFVGSAARGRPKGPEDA